MFLHSLVWKVIDGQFDIDWKSDSDIYKVIEWPFFNDLKNKFAYNNKNYIFKK